MDKRNIAARMVTLVLMLGMVGSAPAQDKKMDTFITTLLGKMTPEEKIGQLNLVAVGVDVTGPVLSKNVEEKIRKGLVGGVFNTYTPAAVRKLQQLAVTESRMKIPMLFGYDVIHGHKTVFPIALGIAATWDMEQVERSARVAAVESSADGLNWTFSPMVDISRDPRWGRVSEGSGEDPWLGSQIAKAMVKGYQGTDLKKDNTILACVKHFALYGDSEAGRDYNTVDMSRIKMYEYYFPPYKAAIDAGVATVMTSFNEVDGIPASANKWLLTDVLRKQWGFSGMIVSDYTSVNEMSAHGLGDLKTVSALALNAGLDMDMVGEGYLSTLGQSLREGKVTQRQIDMACRKVLEAKYKLGLFEDPYRYCNEDRARTEILSKANRQAAREVAERSFVLLKNEGQVLPLKKSGSIALIGPLADNKTDILGSWSAAGDADKAVSVREGIRNLVGDAVRLHYAKGANITDDQAIIDQLNSIKPSVEKDSRSPEEMIEDAVGAANQSDVIVAVLGESQGMSGEAACRTDLGIPASQKKLLEALVRTGKPVVLVLMNGRPLTLTWEAENVSAILETWFGGTEAGNAIANTLFGGYNPSGKLPATFPRSVGQIPLYYNHKMTGRPYDGESLQKYRSRYLDMPNDPLYPFGFGLSYTQFDYSGVTLSKTALSGEESLTATITLTNTGPYAGEEKVQLYITDPVASVTRSVKDLKNMQGIFLKPGESREVSFQVTPADLKFYNSDLQYIWEPGEFIIHIGPNSRDLKSAAINWKKQ